MTSIVIDVQAFLHHTKSKIDLPKWQLIMNLGKYDISISLDSLAISCMFWLGPNSPKQSANRNFYPDAKGLRFETVGGIYGAANFINVN